MKTIVIPLQGLDCVDCARVIETSLKRMPGVQDARLDFARAELTVEGNADPDLLRERIRQLGFTPLTAHARASTSLTFAGFWKTLITDRTLRATLPGLFLLLGSLFLPRLGVNGIWRIILQLGALLAAGFPIFLSGLRSLFLDRKLTINFLLTLAVLGAVVINETPEAFIILILFHLSEAMETYTNDHARAVLTEFADLAPKTAVRAGDFGEETVPIENLALGDVLIVRAGERFPMDGVIVDGYSEINQAPITGESRLIPKQSGDPVISGTINGQGVLKVRVSALAQDTTVQRIVNLVLDARAVKARQEKFIDRFASVYTPIVVAVAVLTALVPTLFFGQPLWNSAAGYGWLHRALRHRRIEIALQRHPAKGFVLHADFVRVVAGQKLTAIVPVHFVGEEAPVKKGGEISHVVAEIEVSCLPKDLSEFIEVDLANAEVGSIIHLSDITAPKGVEFVALAHGNDLAVANVHAPRVAPEAAE